MTEPTVKNTRKTDRFIGVEAWYDRDSDTIKTDFTWKECEGVVRHIMRESSKADLNNITMKFRSRGWKPTSGPDGAKWYQRKILCYYNSEKRGNCDWQLKQIYMGGDLDETVDNKKRNDLHYYGKVGMYQFFPCNEEHGVHKIEGTAAMTHKVLTSPSKLKMTAGEFKRKATSMNPNIHHDDLQRMMHIFGNIMKNNNKKKQGLEEGVGLDSFAAVTNVLERFRYRNVVEREDFTCDKAYLCEDSDGKHCIVDDETENGAGKTPRIIAVMSTEELLLNFYRQHQRFGNHLHFIIDASYRYTTEKNLGYMVVKVASPTQVGKTVAYAITTKEDGAAHEFVFRSIKRSVEEVVNRRMKSGDGFI